MRGSEPGRIVREVSVLRERRPAAVKKLILLSVIIASVVLPARAARAKSGKAGLKKALIQVALFEIIYVILITQVWFRMS